jgi:hypothetical protein
MMLYFHVEYIYIINMSEKIKVCFEVTTNADLDISEVANELFDAEQRLNERGLLRFHMKEVTLFQIKHLSRLANVRKMQDKEEQDILVRPISGNANGSQENSRDHEDNSSLDTDTDR